MRFKKLAIAITLVIALVTMAVGSAAAAGPTAGLRSAGTSSARYYYYGGSGHHHNPVVEACSYQVASGEGWNPAWNGRSQIQWWWPDGRRQVLNTIHIQQNGTWEVGFQVPCDAAPGDYMIVTVPPHDVNFWVTVVGKRQNPTAHLGGPN